MQRFAVVSAREPREGDIRELLHAVDGIVLGIDPRSLEVESITGSSEPLGWGREVWCSPRFWTEVLHPFEADRTDPQLSREMTAAYANKNHAILSKAGVPVTPGTTYLAHFAGPGGA